ncbi:M23 family metallopeptidase [Streptosporangium sp. NPDC087985]|uniref:M23 family metallopeptidase n=1 Tax=Streptosporangium sp. NPDC087985 TaxID=3366196 RepID=UPI0038125436
MILYRCCWVLFFAQLVAGFFFDFSWMWGWIPLGLAIVLQFAVNRQPVLPDPSRAVEVGLPVTGRWPALNSPADKVPSHGTHGYGQSYAIDIVAEPEDQARPRFGWWPVVRRNRDFPAFGAPLLAVADATVVRTTNRHRDHLQRGSLAVREGDRVRAGQPLARCGNSGNSTEPHVHFQLMDGPDLDVAHGVPFSWRGVGVPGNGEVFSADEEPAMP